MPLAKVLIVSYVEILVCINLQVQCLYINMNICILPINIIWIYEVTQSQSFECSWYVRCYYSHNFQTRFLFNNVETNKTLIQIKMIEMQNTRFILSYNICIVLDSYLHDYMIIICCRSKVICKLHNYCTRIYNIKSSKNKS